MVASENAGQSDAAEHPGDAEAYAVFAERMGWAATWEQLGPTARAGFTGAFAAVRAAEIRTAETGSAEPTGRAAKKPERASGAEVLAVLRSRRAARRQPAG
jgi:hypothetical protein